MTGGVSRTRGRPSATSHAEIERVAFELFNERGFEETTLHDIAEAVGVGRRTLFRYFESKSDIPWGEFDRTLVEFGRLLAALPDDLPLHEAVHQGVVAFNNFPEHVQASHRARMRLILTTPELQAHSALRYRDWRAVIAQFVGHRLGVDQTSLLPQVVGHVSLALAIAGHELWLNDESIRLTDAVDQSMSSLERYLAL